MLYFNISASKKAYTYFKEIAMNNMLKERVLVLANYIEPNRAHNSPNSQAFWIVQKHSWL